MTPLLTLESVSVTFGTTTVLRDVSIDVPRGALLGLLGPNGSGKTTMLKVISRGLKPSAGRVLVDGTDATAISHATLARRLAVVPQDTHLAFDYSALEIVLMGRHPHLGTFEIEGPADVAVARQAMHATGTDGLADRAFNTLSGGERQRVVIASALAQLEPGAGHERAHRGDAPVGEPGCRSPAGALLLLDEPTASLDLRYQLETADLLRRLHDDRGMTMVLSTHDLRLARAICTEIVLLSRGRVLAQGRPEAMLTPELVGALYDIPPALAAPVLAAP